MLIDDPCVAQPPADTPIQNFDGSFVRIDNLLTDTELGALQEYFQEHVFWKYGWKSASDKMVFGHWNHDILKTHKSNQDDQSSLLAQDPSLSPVNMVWKKLKNSFLRNHHLVRCYANAHSYGVEGYPHVDSRRPGNFTAILYLNPIWKPEWAGETVFFNEESDIIQAVLPKSGRVAIFDNRVLHAARGVSRICPAIRVTLMFKTKLASAETDDEEFYGGM
ncbi:2OG-Fe(II) oxygenase [Herbaspirillum sp. LeCh32-8]|uniref:2OG-Fe(II) oxygenase n=1 Tax=Herbaspirillum sp. LeCh32-8 TaxID=2821356 RepID=UPI001AE425A5|nr:2OG-Fe(II) oxygenase [Herbaspirillum sp. LeCh32-8]MBP0597886.1 2OG-Fe(II) oxygenase [Herbaspirillum sp. LeCh32-8]